MVKINDSKEIFYVQFVPLILSFLLLQTTGPRVPMTLHIVTLESEEVALYHAILRCIHLTRNERLSSISIIVGATQSLDRNHFLGFSASRVVDHSRAHFLVFKVSEIYSAGASAFSSF